MAKRNGKNFKRKGNNICHPNAKIKKMEVPNIIPAETTASFPESNDDVGPSQVKEKDGEKTKCISGFIFMCNASTKLECYQYRVFGLPSWQKELVEKIKPGAKLFLYDFGLKLLYGIYMATSVGNLNLEPAAFRGKFPAQVKFNIFKECLPLPESTLRHVIKDNYTGSKFNQELSKKQVKNLLSAFRPLAASSSIPIPQALAYVPISRAIPPSENQFKHRAVMEVPYIPEIQYNRTRQLVESQTVPMENYLHQGYYRTLPPYVQNVHPTLGRQNLPSTSSYYIASSQQPSFPEGVAHAGQEQPYFRYRHIDERTPHAPVTSLERYTTMEGRAPCNEVNRQYTHQLPLQRGGERDAVYQGNSNPSQHASLVPAAQHRHQLPSQQYQDGSVSQPYVPEYVPAYTYSGATVAAQCTSASISQPHVPEYVPAYTYSGATVAAQYTSASVSQPHVPEYVPAYTYPDATVAAQYTSASVSESYVPAYAPASDVTATAQYTSASVATQWPQGVAPHAPVTSYYPYQQ